jgi:LacI family transcriptional regulator
MARVRQGPSMSDIANRLGVSQATVSLVLNNAPGTRISKDTRARVLAVAEELGYQKTRPPKQNGRVIGMLINDVVGTQHVATLLEGVRDEAAASGFVVSVIPTMGLPETEGEALDYLMTRPLAGVIYASLITLEVRPPERLRAIPTVLLNCHAAKEPYSSVVPGDFAGAFAATSLLLENGHRRIGMLNGEVWVEAARERARGYTQALAAHDIAVDPHLVIAGGLPIAHGREGARRLLDLPQPPTAIFCYSDRVALGAYQAVYARGLKIPNDIAIVGFDNEDFSAELRPPLTTLTLPHDEMARWSVERLLENPDPSQAASKAKRLKMECPLVLRQSVAGPR